MTPDQLAAAVRSAVLSAIDEGALALDATAVPADITIERPRSAEHGDYATNIALQLAKPMLRVRSALALSRSLDRGTMSIARAEISASIGY